MISYFCLDLETNGINTKTHEVHEISIIRCSDKVQLTRFIKLDHPENSSLDAMAITKKTMNDYLYGDSKENVISEIEKFLNEDGSNPANRCIVGHNVISFDKRFIHSLWDKCGKKFPASLWLDTMKLSRLAAKKQGILKPRVNLEAACDMFGIKKTASFHNAKMDTRNTYYLWKKLTEELNIDYIEHIKNIPHSTDDTVDKDMEELMFSND